MKRLTQAFFSKAQDDLIVAKVVKKDSDSRTYKITGQWSGSMLIEGSKGDQRLFLDTSADPICSKYVEPISLQEEFESQQYVHLIKDMEKCRRCHQGK